MKKLYHANLKFHPVGQGCFYTGCIAAQKTKRVFNFVYDCGTNSDAQYLTDEINSYRVKVKKEVLDLCIISHFHKDHMSGIPELLKGPPCRRIVIPYYDPVERLIIYFRSEGTDDQHREMLQDPFNYFSGDNFNIEEVIVLGGNTGNNEIPVVAPGPPDNEPDREDELPGNTDDLDTFVNFYDTGSQLNINQFLSYQYSLNNNELPIKNEKVKFFRMPYQMRAAHWRFIFYCRQAEDGKDDGYNEKRTLLYKEINAYYDKLKKDPKSSVTEFKDLFNGKYIYKLRTIYGSIFGSNELNGTSLAVFHEPMLPPEIYIPFTRFHEWQFWPYQPDRYGTLLTGDIELETKEKLLLFQSYYKHYLDRVHLFQVMHHGSDKNWPFGLTASKLHTFPEYVINHGAGRAHHPGSEVIKLLRSVNPLHILLNNEVTPISYLYNFRVT